MEWIEAVLLFQLYGNPFYEIQKIFQQQLSHKACIGFQENQNRQASILAQSLLATLEKFEAHLQQYVLLSVKE